MIAARPALLAVLTTVLLAGCGGGEGEPAAPAPRAAATTTTDATARADRAARQLRRLERRYDARLGLYAVDTGTGRELTHRADERFAYASTFKALLAGEVLRRTTPDELARTLPITAEAVAEAYSPVTAKHVGGQMSLSALAAAAVRHSDNAAANLLLDEVGGPRGLDAALARLGDDTTRMERGEPELNDWAPGQRRDTTSPRAFAANLRAYVLGEALEPADRRRLAGWLKTNTTGDTVIRAGVPPRWRVGDKTGTGGTYGTRNDIAVLWRPDGDPIVLAVFTNRHTPEAEPDDALLARAAAVVATALG